MDNMISTNNNAELVNAEKDAENRTVQGISLSLSKTQFEIPAGRTAEIEAIIENHTDAKETVIFTVSSSFVMHDKDLEWRITTSGLASKKSKKNKNYISDEEINELVGELHNREPFREFYIGARTKKSIMIGITTPKAATLGDSATMVIKVALKRDPTIFAVDSVSISLVSAIVAVKTSLGQELPVAMDLGKRVKINNVDYIYSLMVPTKIKGYVFVETIHPDQILAFVKTIRGIKGVVKGEMRIDEILHYLTPRPATEGLNVGDIVELIDGPFKGERAKIIEIDVQKNNIVVELIEAIVPIPLNVRADSVKVIENVKE